MKSVFTARRRRDEVPPQTKIEVEGYRRTRKILDPCTTQVTLLSTSTYEYYIRKKTYLQYEITLKKKIPRGTTEIDRPVTDPS